MTVEAGNKDFAQVEEARLPGKVPVLIVTALVQAFRVKSWLPGTYPYLRTGQEP